MSSWILKIQWNERKITWLDSTTIQFAQSLTLSNYFNFDTFIKIFHQPAMQDCFIIIKSVIDRPESPPEGIKPPQLGCAPSWGLPRVSHYGKCGLNNKEILLRDLLQIPNSTQCTSFIIVMQCESFIVSKVVYCVKIVLCPCYFIFILDRLPILIGKYEMR